MATLLFNVCRCCFFSLIHFQVLNSLWYSFISINAKRNNNDHSENHVRRYTCLLWSKLCRFSNDSAAQVGPTNTNWAITLWSLRIENKREKKIITHLSIHAHAKVRNQFRLIYLSNFVFQLTRINECKTIFIREAFPTEIKFVLYFPMEKRQIFIDF